ncbi:MAG TPA: protein-L-isoaspartate(D-aspartate) O-methyltransferase [Kofleriaceae bacterium]|nr:protein-L-isoaspartate(D-aspartate) O-methyltransferase [Kofleriaceae bacterium]
MARALVTPELERARMVEHHLRRRDIRDPLVLQAFARVPREAFVSPDTIAHAYADAPLPIGLGQTISQPYVVALTVQALQLRGHEHVLEIGTGSGYAAAILGAMVREVDTVERLGELARTAAQRLHHLGFSNVYVHHADGSLGWPPGAPYEAICVAAGAPAPPPALLDQLAIGGRLVLPSGGADQQRLVRIVRRDERSFVEEDLGDVRFVPLVGEQGWPERKPPARA